MVVYRAGDLGSPVEVLELGVRLAWCKCYAFRLSSILRLRRKERVEFLHESSEREVIYIKRKNVSTWLNEGKYGNLLNFSSVSQWYFFLFGTEDLGLLDRPCGVYKHSMWLKLF